MAPKTMAAKPAAGPETEIGELLMNPITIPPTILLKFQKVVVHQMLMQYLNRVAMLREILQFPKEYFLLFRRIKCLFFSLYEYRYGFTINYLEMSNQF